MNNDQTTNRSDEPQTDQQTSRSRRALIKAGWVLPVVMAVGIPKNAFAQYNGGTTPTL